MARTRARKWNHGCKSGCMRNLRLHLEREKTETVVKYYPGFSIKANLRSVYVNGTKSDILFIQREDKVKILIFSYIEDGFIVELTRVMAPRCKEEGNAIYKNIVATERKSKRGYTYYTLRG